MNGNGGLPGRRRHGEGAGGREFWERERERPGGGDLQGELSPVFAGGQAGTATVATVPRPVLSTDYVMGACLLEGSREARRHGGRGPMVNSPFLKSETSRSSHLESRFGFSFRPLDVSLVFPFAFIIYYFF